MADQQVPGEERIGPLTQRFSELLDRLLGLPLKFLGGVIEEVEGKSGGPPLLLGTLDRRHSRAILVLLVVGIFVALFLIWRFWNLRESGA